MKRLILLRHAKSSWDDRGLDDHDRPLAKRGLQDAPRMGQRLAERSVDPDLILVSSAKRARQTAKLVAAELGHSDFEFEIEPGIYLASPGELLQILKSVSDDVNELVLIGHNPGLTQLANLLLPGLGLYNLPTTSAVAIDVDTASWQQLDAAERKLRFYDYPKNPEPA